MIYKHTRNENKDKSTKEKKHQSYQVLAAETASLQVRSRFGGIGLLDVSMS